MIHKHWIKRAPSLENIRRKIQVPQVENHFKTSHQLLF